MQKFSVLIICLSVLGCATRPDTAPIENGTNIPSYLLQSSSSKPQLSNVPHPETSTQSSTTTMGALSDNGNNVKALPVTPIAKKTSSASLSNNSSTTTTLTPNTDATSGWIAPTAGKTDGYKASSKGMDFYGNVGQPIYAVNDGKVVYSGNGLKGYGNLIIIKHDSTYLTAYAQNKTNLVKEGASVKRGQKIAEMGMDDNNKAVLHFELRKNGKPINPLTLIKSE